MVAYSSSRAPHRGGYTGTYQGRQGILAVWVREALVRVQDGVWVLAAWVLVLGVVWAWGLDEDEGGVLALDLDQAEAHRASSLDHRVQNSVSSALHHWDPIYASEHHQGPAYALCHRGQSNKRVHLHFVHSVNPVLFPRVSALRRSRVPDWLSSCSLMQVTPRLPESQGPEGSRSVRPPWLPS